MEPLLSRQVPSLLQDRPLLPDSQRRLHGGRLPQRRQARRPTAGQVVGARGGRDLAPEREDPARSGRRPGGVAERDGLGGGGEVHPAGEGAAAAGAAEAQGGRGREGRGVQLQGRPLHAALRRLCGA